MRDGAEPAPGSRIPRRDLVAALAAAGASGLAGCSGDSGDSGDGDGDGDEGGDGGGDGPGGDGGGDGSGNGTGTGTESEPTPVPGSSGPGWPVKIGLLRPADGSLAVMGEWMEKAARLAVAQVDAAPTGFSIDLAVEETDGTAESAVDGAAALVDEGYEILVGPAGDEAALAVAREVVLEREAVAISPIAGSDELLDLDTRVARPDGSGSVLLQYTTAPTARSIGDRLAQHVALQPETYEEIAILYEDHAWGRSVDANVTDEVELRGPSVTANVAVSGPDAGADSYAARIEAALADDPDGLVLATDPSTGIAVLREYYESFDETPLLMADRLFLHSVGASVDVDTERDLVLGTKPEWTSERPEERTVRAVDTVAAPFHWAWLHEYGEWPAAQAAQTYDAVLPMFLCGIRAGEDDYAGPAISYEIQNVANRQEDTGGITIAGVDWETFFQTNAEDESFLVAIADGLVNNYRGPTGSVLFTDQGDLESSGGELWHFDDDAQWGFREFDPFADG